MKRALTAVSLLMALAPGARAFATQDAPPAHPAPVTVTLRALEDTVVAHQTAWVEVRIANNTDHVLHVPYRSEKIPAEWRFTDDSGKVLVDWPADDEMKDAPLLTLGAGEEFYDVLSPESSYGVLTNPGTVYAFCRLGTVISTPVAVSRRPATAAEHSALKGLGPMHQSSAREKAQMELWSLCGRGNDYFDCDEALFTVAWDRMMVSPSAAQAVVDSLIAQAPSSGWCRPALYGLIGKMPESVGRRYLETVTTRKAGGVAEACAVELLRRARYSQFPSGKTGKH